MVERVRQHYPATLNLGTPGGGPLIMLAQLREYLPALRPRIVLWCHFSGNDLLDLRLESEHPLLRRYLAGGFTQGLAGRQDELDRAMSDYAQNTLLTALLRRSRRRLELQSLLPLRAAARRGRPGAGRAQPPRALGAGVRPVRPRAGRGAQHRGGVGRAARRRVPAGLERAAEPAPARPSTRE